MLSIKQTVPAVVLFLINLADFITNWLLYADVYTVKKGIVYGPVDAHLVTATVVFAAIGSIFFILEILNIFLGFCKIGEICDSNYISGFRTVVVEIPQMVLSLVVALCREEPISRFQFSKAIVIIISIFIRYFILGVKYFHGKLVKHHKKIIICILIGNVLAILFSVTLLCLNYLTRDDNGDPYFLRSTTDFDKTLSKRPYFMKVSVFMYLPELNPTQELNQTHESSVKLANWVRMTSLSDLLTKRNEELKVDLETKTPGTMTMAVWSGTREGPLFSWNLSGCYQIANSIPNIAENSTCEHLNKTSSAFKSYLIDFKYKHPMQTFRSKLLGEIYVNIRIKTHLQCREIDNFAESLEEMKNNSSLVMHYYRECSCVSSEDTHLLRSKGQVNFYNSNDIDMIDVKKVWKTGWCKCEPNGSFGPVFSKDEPFSC